MKRPVRLAVTLSNEERRLWIEVKGDTQNDALADKVIVALVKDGWKIKDQERITYGPEVIAYIRSKKEIGASLEELAIEFNVKSGNIIIQTDKLRLGSSYSDGPCPYADSGETDGGKIVIVPCGLTSKYIASEFIKKVVREEKQAMSAVVGSKPVVIIREPETDDASKVAVPEMSKAEGKRQRKLIVDRATKDNILGDSFKQDFMGTFTELERQYVQSLDSFRYKLMITEIKKKP